MSKTIKLRKELTDTLHEKFLNGKGTSKHEDKHADGVHRDVIYSQNTLKSYKKHVSKFVDFCYEKDIKNKEAAKGQIVPFLQNSIDKNMSPSTIHLQASAIAKAFNTSYKNFDIELPKRERSKITRSRSDCVRDQHFSVEKNKDVVTFASCTGLRRNELENVTGKDVFTRDTRVFVNVQRGKGGKQRYVEVCGSVDEKQRIIEMAKEKGNDKIFGKVHNAMDVHAYRSVYANRVYEANKRDLSTLSRNEIYYCRKDLKGVAYDKKAMLITSRNLGHNRIDVIAQSYLR